MLANIEAIILHEPYPKPSSIDSNTNISRSNYQEDSVHNGSMGYAHENMPIISSKGINDEDTTEEKVDGMVHSLYRNEMLAVSREAKEKYEPRMIYAINGFISRSTSRSRAQWSKVCFLFVMRHQNQDGEFDARDFEVIVEGDKERVF